MQDFSFLAYRSLLALLRVVRDMPALRRQELALVRVPARVLPPDIADVSLSGKYCTAYHGNQRACQGRRAARYCRWVPGDAQTPSNCVPRNPRTRSANGVGANTSGRARPPSAAPRLAQQPPVAEDAASGAHHPPQRRGTYAAGWRVPLGPLPQLPL